MEHDPNMKGTKRHVNDGRLLISQADPKSIDSLPSLPCVCASVSPVRLNDEETCQTGTIHLSKLGTDGDSDRLGRKLLVLFVFPRHTGDF